MNMHYQQQSKANKIIDLETLLMKLYPAGSIALLHEQFLLGVTGDQELLDILGNSWLLQPAEKLVKQTRVEILVEVFSNEALFKAWYALQSTLAKKVLERLVWYGNFTLEQLEKRVGEKVAAPHQGQRKYFTPFDPVQGLELVFLEITSSYSTFKKGYTKKDITAYLPEILRKTLRTLLPVPEQSVIQPLKKREQTDFSSCFEPTILTELTRMVEFIRQGHLTLKKNGQPSVKGLRDLVRVAGLQEFYPAGSGKDLERLRVEILTSFLLSLDYTKAGSLSSPQVFLRKAFDLWIKDSEYLLTEHLLDHLRIRWNNYYADASWNVKKGLLRVLKQLPAKEWVSIVNIDNFCIVRQINLLEKEMSVLEYQEVEKNSYGTWNRSNYVNSRRLSEVVNQPMLRAFFFLAASLGLVVIGYNLPVNPVLQRPKHEYLSRFDGLNSIRITELGAYVTGKTKKYTVTLQSPQAEAVFKLDTTRLLLTMEGNDPIVELTLDKLLEPVGSGRYMMSFASLFKECSSKKDIQQKISLFRKTICNNPPKIWQEFFTKALKRVNPLRPEPELKIFTLQHDEELLRLFTSDPDIRSLIVKVEGLRIAVKLSDIAKLSKKLKKHGYLLTGKSLIT